MAKPSSAKQTYVRVCPKPNADTVMRQPSWIAHYNDVDPHKRSAARVRAG
jgi:hypothetical protein